MPPSFRFPPLREGNRARRAYSVPPACRGNLKEGVINCCFFVNFGLAIGMSASVFMPSLMRCPTTYGAQGRRKRARNTTGADSGTRTHDLRITSAPLYR